MSYGFGRINDLAFEAWKNSEEKGFHENCNPADVRDQLSVLALIHTEVSEACECVRKPELEHKLGEELADIVIRTIEFAEQKKINIEQEIVNKMFKNTKREYKHGGRLA